MKGLMYKELYLCRKNYILYAVISLLLAVLGILIMLSTICGNLKGWPQSNPSEYKTIAVTFIYLPFVIAAFATTSAGQSVCKDYQSKWMKYSYTLPTKVSLAVGARYLVSLIVLAASFVINILYVTLMCEITNISFSSSIMKNTLVIVVVAVVAACISIPMSYRYKTTNAVATRVGITGVILYLVCGFLFVSKILETEKKGEAAEAEFLRSIVDYFNKFMDFTAKYSFIIIPVVICISFVLSATIYKRREK